MAFALHALALHEGQLTLVQPLLVTMVLFALPASRAVNGTAGTRGRTGLGGGVGAGPDGLFRRRDPVSSSTAGADVQPAIRTADPGRAHHRLVHRLARRRPGGQAAALLGGAAGIAFAGVAALVKTATSLLTHGAGALCSSWQLYALVGVGAIGIGLSQLAYRTGPLSASLPALNSVNPLASVLIGAVVFDEHVHTGLVPAGIELLGLAIIALAAVALSRLPAVDSLTLNGAPRSAS